VNYKEARKLTDGMLKSHIEQLQHYRSTQEECMKILEAYAIVADGSYSSKIILDNFKELEATNDQA